MQQKIAAHLFAALLIGVTASAAPNASENFNSRKGTPLRQLKALLQNNCWTFHHFDINQNGWNPAIEGDGAMVADINALEFSNSGIYTPMLVIPGQISTARMPQKKKNIQRASKTSIPVSTGSFCCTAAVVVTLALL
jgi:hypothetical protein